MSAKRPRCPRCLRPLSHCLCALIPALQSRCHVLVIQHPSECGHALNTAVLLVEGLVNADLLVAEQLTEHPDWLARLQDRAWRTELLFPGETAVMLEPDADDPRPRRLVLLDGTWRKARKLIHMNPVLQQLPQVTLPVAEPSRYRLRKSCLSGGLSSIEAGARALQIIDPGIQAALLLRPFEALIDGQIEAMGEALFEQNHKP